MVVPRLIGVGLVLALSAATTPTIARTPTSEKTKIASKHDRRKTAQKKKTKKRASKRKSVAAAKKLRPRVKTTGKPLVKVAKLQADGRVKYGPDRLPPGFAWPPTDQMKKTGEACERELDRIGVTWKPGPATGKIADPIVVPAMQIGGVTYTNIYKRGPHAIDCQFVHTLALLGPKLRELGVREVQFGSIYRNTMARSHGQTKDFLSRHALGIAMDIRSFVDDHGRVAVVELDYLKGDPLLHGIEDLINGDTRFRQVLTPANDPISHDDHFHIEASVDFTGFR
jgi:hypothetical protein